MTKYLFVLFFVVAPFLTEVSKAEGTDQNSFESELRMLESEESKTFNRAEEVTLKEINNADEMMLDSVSTSNAGVQKEEIPSEKPEIKIRPAAVKNRRVRSR
jgi:hypothetical protein